MSQQQRAAVLLRQAADLLNYTIPAPASCCKGNCASDTLDYNTQRSDDQVDNSDNRSPWCNGYGVRLATGRSSGSIPTVGAFFRSHPKTPSTGSRPRKRTRERLYKPKAFDAIELK
ncbi:hypothetical protein DPMN_001450 [Dreissena polymorpha]|uniref:Uncharacterized protein n=1 Tax=Dreissena polymorpha TaxID=45954 RepID=A0A9D4RSX5_DREPO|nr:hypothetical protein DPMN_001450 [Dreissena polymorpha]